MNAPVDLLVVGAGPVGLACALEASRAGLTHVVLEKGALLNTLVNWPTHVVFFSTPELLEIGGHPFVCAGPKPTRREGLDYYRKVMEREGLEVRLGTPVTSLTKADGLFSAQAPNGIFSARAAVVATGFYDTPNLLGVPGEDLPKVSHYYREPYAHAGTDVLVVGGKNSAVEAALDLHRHGARVTMAIRGAGFGASVKYWLKPDVENRVREGSIRALFDTTVAAIEERTVTLRSSGGTAARPNDFVYALTGYRPDFPFLRAAGIVVTADLGVVHDAETMETNVSGLYVAGVVAAGRNIGSLFIENGRAHAARVVRHLLAGRGETQGPEVPRLRRFPGRGLTRDNPPKRSGDMTSSAWLVCSSCGLRHSPRPDGRCPRCHGALLAEADAADSSVLRPPPVSRTLSEHVPPGWRIAGAAFIANGILGAVSAFAVRNPFAGAGRILAGSAVSALLAFLLGAGLLKGSDAARKAALAIAAVALAATGLFAVFTHFWLAAGLAALLCGAYFLLLVGEPGAGRLAAGSALLAGGLLLGAVAVLNPRLVASRFLAGSGVIDAAPVTRVASGTWSLTFPPDLWYGAKAAPAPVPNVAFERQFLRPEGPAHAIVVSVKVPANRGFDMDAMADAISKATRRQFDEWEVLEVSPLPGRGGTRVIHVRSSLKGEKLEMLCGLFPNPPAFYEVVVGAERSAFPRLRGELQAILESFQSSP